MESNKTIKKWIGRIILITEDLEHNYIYLKSLIESRGGKCLWADDGKKAVDLCREDKSIDMVLMDINLPKMNGRKAIQAIKQIRPDLTIIAITAYAYSGEKERTLSSGADEFITKPVQKDLLFDTIDHFFELENRD